MQRGILNIGKTEIQTVINLIDLQKYAGTPLAGKLTAVATSQEPVVQIELSADELENLLDDIGAPNSEMSEELRSAISQMSSMLNDMNDPEKQGY